MNSDKPTITNFTSLITWQEAHKLTIWIYLETKKFPKEEKYSLVDQMRRCSVSIGSNIAEGFSRNTYKEKVQFYRTAKGSLTELQNQLLVSRDVGFIDNLIFSKLADQTVVVSKLLTGLIRSTIAKFT